ncbi:MAG: hypothetical protein HS111_28755 [Kofleriaceae bacterium]|nr:hypothetical protein [Kofleriaceae bacterium]
MIVGPSESNGSVASVPNSSPSTFDRIASSHGATSSRPSVVPFSGVSRNASTDEPSRLRSVLVCTEQLA